MANLSDLTNITAEILARYNFTDLAKAAHNLHSLAGDNTYTQKIFAEIVEAVLPAISASPDPDAALNNLERYAQMVFDRNLFYAILRDAPALIPLLTTSFGSSQYLSDTLIRHPEYFEWMMEPGVMSQTKNRETMYQELSRMAHLPKSLDNKLNAMRRYKRRETLRIGLRDLLNVADLETTTVELSNLAEASLQVAYELAQAEITDKYGLPQSVSAEELAKRGGSENAGAGTYAVIGMGKLGGRELNFSSDVDIMFVYSHEGQTSKGFENRHYFNKMSEFIIRAMSEITEEGYVFRMDARLRPESSAGTIARSIDSYEAYYEGWGETFDRQALIKARYVAGDEKLGRMFIEMIQPFIYQRYLDEYQQYLDEDSISLVKEEIAQTKKRIERRLGDKKTTHVKLGIGSIREIEFIVQMMQLVRGGRDKQLRERNTLKAIDALSAKGHFNETERNHLAEAYRFLRTVEHRIQIESDRQLHVLPDKPDDLNKLAKRTGYADSEAFMPDYKKHTNRVRQVFEQMFKPDYSTEKFDLELLLESNDKSEIEPVLKPYGFRDYNIALRRLKLLATGSANIRYSPKTRFLFRRLASSLLQSIGASPDPDMALSNFESFIQVVGARESYYSMFLETPATVELFAKLCGSSKFLSEILIGQPELLDVLTRFSLMEEPTFQANIRTGLRTALSQSSSEPFETLRRFKNGETLRIGIRDILREADLVSTTEELSDLAEVVLQEACELVKIQLSPEWGYPKSADGDEALFAIIGLGKLGGRELNYNSDLDVIYVYSVDGTTTTGKSNYDYFTKLGQELATRLNNASGGAIYDIDLRLRPFGKAGSIALSLQGYQDYYAKHAETWERQALIKARPVAGDVNLGEEFMQIASDFTYSQPLNPDQIAEIVHTRRRKEDKSKKESRRTRRRGQQASFAIDVKAGYGGIADIEFIVQTRQLICGSEHSSVRERNTLLALDKLWEVNALTEAQHRQLSQSYQFLRMVENRLRIVHDRSLNALPTDKYELEKLAKRLGYEDNHAKAADKFRQDYRDNTNRNRELFNEILGTANNTTKL